MAGLYPYAVRVRNPAAVIIDVGAGDKVSAVPSDCVEAVGKTVNAVMAYFSSDLGSTKREFGSGTGLRYERSIRKRHTQFFEWHSS
jgi:hypothetical protein